MDTATQRAKILEAFGATEDDMAALKRLEDANGYTASKAAVEWFEAEFRRHMAAALKGHLASTARPPAGSHKP